MNIVDLIIVLALVLYVATHVSYGVLPLIQKLFSFLGSLLISFLLYGYGARWINSHWTLRPGLADAISFLVFFVFFQIALHVLLGIIFDAMPWEFKFSRFSKILAIIPAAIDGLILISLTLLLLVVAPVLPAVKAPIEDSFLGAELVDKASGIEGYVDQVFGQAAQESLGFLTVKPSEMGSISLPYTPKDLTTDTTAELQMLNLVNEERSKLGLNKLVLDEKLTTIARAHSMDMWQRHYFSHIDPDGNSPFDRLQNAGVNFSSAGENLALARSVESAHTGLMNSEGHRRNILDPSYNKIGIGAIDGGIYGIMFTQLFTN